MRLRRIGVILLVLACILLGVYGAHHSVASLVIILLWLVFVVFDALLGIGLIWLVVNTFKSRT
jgi:hypothetical protein